MAGKGKLLSLSQVSRHEPVEEHGSLLKVSIGTRLHNLLEQAL